MDRDALTVDAATIRTLRAADCPRLVAMDYAISGRKRQAWYEGKLKRALSDADVKVSLGAELDGMLVGALLGSVHYGEFGQPEPVAILDTVLVDRDFARRGIARALLEQLVFNLGGLRIERLRTEVGWNDQELIGFFARFGFAPVPRLVLELAVSTAG
jgi:ribosomal protein S18 acetylase RimI-like enzyme